MTGTSRTPTDRQSPPRAAVRRRAGGLPSLNHRQQTYLDAIYEIDLQAERDQARRWRQNLRREPADLWRWIPYDQPPFGESTAVQQLLAKSGVLDHGAGATLAALARRGLLRQRRTNPDGPHHNGQMHVRLTSQGRALARHNRPEPPAENSELPPWLRLALVKVAGSNGPLPKTEISRAAAKQLGPGELGFITDANAWAYEATTSGHDYLRQHPVDPDLATSGGSP